MKYGSVCSGVEAATVAWHGLGWEPQWFSEIEKFPSEVLQHHYPAVPNLGDMTKFKEWPSDRSIDLLVGGTPCQSFSVAGLRKGLDDPRGNLMLTYLAIAAQYQPQWLVWENVPGVLSSNRGRDFGTFLGALGKLGYGFAYRVLDAQYFGVAQRRRRVFVVGYLGDWRRAAAVLFERESMSGHPAPSRETREDVAPTVTQGAPFSRTGNQRVEAEALVTARMRGFGDYECDGTASALKARDYKDATDLIAFPAEMSGTQAATTPNLSPALSVGHTTAVTVIDRAAFNQGKNAQYEPRIEEAETTPTIVARGPHAVAYGWSEELNALKDLQPTIQRGGEGGRHEGVMQHDMRVRRLTPIECERLQGFPDNYTQIPWRNKGAEDCPDGPRYKAMGNSMAVPVMRWIGERIDLVNKLQLPDTGDTQ